MFKKITSNRDPEATLGSELKKEFGAYFDKLTVKAKALLSKYPRQCFALMVTCILGSGILAFTIMRVKHPPALPLHMPAGQGPASGLAQIVRTGQALQAVLALHRRVDTILHKPNMGPADSLALRAAFKQLDSIQRSSRP